MIIKFGGPRQTKTIPYPIVFTKIIYLRKIEDTYQDTWFKCCFFDQMKYLVALYSPTSAFILLYLNNT